MTPVMAVQLSHGYEDEPMTREDLRRIVQAGMWVRSLQHVWAHTLRDL